MMILTIAARELRSLFLSPLAWVILAAVQTISALIFLWLLGTYVDWQAKVALQASAPGVTTFVGSSVFSSVALIMILAAPILTMRLISEERRNQTISLLMSAPVSMSEIIIGKYLGILGFFCVILALVALMPLSLLLGATVDMGIFFTGLLGLFLVLASFASLGLYMSTLTTQPAVAAISTIGVLFILWILKLVSSSADNDSLVSYVSLLHHYQSMMKGVINTGDVAYYLIFIATFLVLSIRKLDAQRLQR